MYGAGAAWSRLFLPGAGPCRSEPESAPGPWPSGAGAGATQKSGGSATLSTILRTITNIAKISWILLDPDPGSFKKDLKC